MGEETLNPKKNQWEEHPIPTQVFIEVYFAFTFAAGLAETKPTARRPFP
jgi:hypothetical protein